ncbi:unnamed protein product [Alopecurus aequalis]
MDIDEVDSAAIHTHDRLTGDPRPSGIGGGNEGWTCHLLRRGWDLTRKAAIAGAAATAAPVVAPPLIVLSAAGVALSVPFAAYLASLAATNHLMDALLRSCYPPAQPYYRQEDDDAEQEFLDASEEYGQGAPAFGHLDTETEQAEGDTPLPLLPRNHGVSEAPAFADDEVEGKEEEGEISAQESGQDSYTSDRGDETEEHTAVEGREAAPPRGFGGVSASAKPLFSHEDNLVQKKGEGEFSVLDSGQQSFQPENWNEKADAVYSENKEEDGEEYKSTTETVSEGLYFPEPRVPASGGDDNVVQKRGEGEFSEQDSGQQSKNWNEKEEEDGKSSEENKSTDQTLRVPASDDKDNVDVVQEKGEGEFCAHNLGQYSLLSSVGDKNEQGMTMEEKKSTEGMTPRDNTVSESPAPVFHGEDNVVQSKEGFEGNSNTDTLMGEVAEVQVEIIAIVAPESEVLPRSNLVAHESPADPVTGEIVDVQVDSVAAAASESEVLPLSSLAALTSQSVAETAHIAEVNNEKGMSMDENKTTEDMPPRDSVVSESSVPVLGVDGEDDVAQSQEGFEVAVQEVLDEANSNTDIVMREIADVQLQIISVAAPESEVLPPSNLVAHESPADPVTGEIIDVQVDIVAAAAPENEVLDPSNLATSESPADSVTGQIVDVEVDIVAAAETASEVLQVVEETAHVGNIIGITVMEDIVMDFDDVNKEGVSFVPLASVHDGEDVMSSGSTPYLSTVEEEAFGSRVAAGGEAHYTEEQLREQLDTIRTITGYGAVPYPTLEGELAGLYIFVGVEPAVGSSDTSDRLLELNAKLQFLKSIIGVD